MYKHTYTYTYIHKLINMSSFLRLSNILINKTYIQSILIQKNKYIIKMIPDNFILDGTWMVASGYLKSDIKYTEIILTKEDTKEDYDKTTHWIESN